MNLLTNNHFRSRIHPATFHLHESTGGECSDRTASDSQEDRPMRPTISKTVLGGVAGGAVFCVGTFVTFVLIGSGLDRRSGPLVDPSKQSPKLMAVFTAIEPLPLFETAPFLIMLAYVVFGVGHAFLFRSVRAAWPPAKVARMWRLALLTWSLS